MTTAEHETESTPDEDAWYAVETLELAASYLAGADEALGGGLDRGTPVDHVLKMAVHPAPLGQVRTAIGIAASMTTGSTADLLREALRTAQTRTGNQ